MAHYRATEQLTTVPRVVVISDRSLFAEGVASRLMQFRDRVDVRLVDPGDENYLEQVAKLQPTAVIIDARDVQVTQCCLLCDLLLSLPTITILRLSADHQDIQVVTSVQQQFDTVRDLMHIIAQLPAGSAI
jgi:DNA-binding NarL/FixJ family response regulator